MQIKGSLTDRSGRAWDRFVTSEGVSTAALLEALASALADGTWKPTKRIVADARRIDRERSSRRP